MKTYKKDNYVATQLPDREFYKIEEIYDDDGRMQVPQRRIISKGIHRTFIVDMGFEEVTEEPVQVPVWFRHMLLETTSIFDGNYVTTITEDRVHIKDIYKAFLKYYPKREELPVEEIIQKLEDAHVEYQKSGEDGYNYLYKRFGDILRQYTIKQDTLQQLDVEKITQELMEMCERHFEVEDPETVELGIRKTLSKYGTPQTTLEPFDVEKAAEEIVPKSYRRCVIEVDGGRMDLDARTFKQMVEEVLSKYGTPKITKDEVNKYLSSYTDSKFVQIVVLNFLESKGLLDKSK